MDLQYFEARVFMPITLVFLSGFVFWLCDTLILKPKRMRGFLRKQGIIGPSPVFLLGNILEIKKTLKNSSGVAAASNDVPVSHEAASLLFPFIEKWRKQYGQMYVFSLGNTQILTVTQADVVKDVTTFTSPDLGKPSYQQKERGPLLGHGILTSNGTLWAHHRKVLAPAFYMDKVKVMINLITESSITLVNSWKSKIEETESGTAEIKIDDYMRSFSGDVISRACFGSNYSKGEEIFLKLRLLQKLMSKKSMSTGIPGMTYLPTKTNREAWTLEKEVRSLILEVVKERHETGQDEKDLLQKVLEGAKNSGLGVEGTDRFIVDNCKNIYLAGYETTAVAATWCLMLLASNQEWQDLVRDEVLRVYGGQIPNTDMLRKLKKLTMVIHESLRLYPPVPVVSREALKDIKLGKFHVPKGANVWSMVITLHTDLEIWGADAYKFNPARFANGVIGACKLPHVYMPFGVGPRVCLGQNLAMVELKTLIALIVSEFSFTLSPNYKHSPALRLVIEPEDGVDLLVRKL